jgi:hypothetical protein
MSKPARETVHCPAPSTTSINVTSGFANLKESQRLRISSYLQHYEVALLLNQKLDIEVSAEAGSISQVPASAQRIPKRFGYFARSADASRTTERHNRSSYL